MSDLENFTKLKKRVAETQREADKAQGAYTAAMSRIGNEFGCKTIEEAEALLAKAEQDAVVAEDAFSEAFKDYTAKHGDFLK